MWSYDSSHPSGNSSPTQSANVCGFVYLLEQSEREGERRMKLNFYCKQNGFHIKNSIVKFASCASPHQWTSQLSASFSSNLQHFVCVEMLTTAQRTIINLKINKLHSRNLSVHCTLSIGVHFIPHTDTHSAPQHRRLRPIARRHDISEWMCWKISFAVTAIY